MLRAGEVEQFQKTLYAYYHDNLRDLPWRMPEPDGTYDPYKILVSELMLQQTQVLRVIPKFTSFLDRFPNLEALANASLEDVYGCWQGLGYNRRARFLREGARQITEQHNGSVPTEIENLTKLPGIGYNTACAIAVYSYNQPHIFIETNVRTVYLHHFFPTGEAIHDENLKPLIEQTMDVQNSREFYWALMDYGTFLKKEYGNPNLRSKHYVKQPAFEGSLRQIRGLVLKTVSTGPVGLEVLHKTITDDRLDSVLEGLVRDKLIEVIDGTVRIAR